MDGFAWTCDDVICESQQFITGQLCGCSTLSLGESRSWLFRPSRVVALPFSSSPQVPVCRKTTTTTTSIIFMLQQGKFAFRLRIHPSISGSWHRPLQSLGPYLKLSTSSRDITVVCEGGSCKGRRRRTRDHSLPVLVVLQILY